MKIFHSRILFTLLAFFLIQTMAYAATLYVKTDGGNDLNPGTSWAGAKKTVQAAINVANAGDQIWVAAGTYNEHIVNKQVGNVAVDMGIYGGFAGTETFLSQRNIETNITVLHGTNNGIVVTINNAAGRETRIDGFYITGGNKSSTPGDPGGGINITGSAPTIANNIIKGNLSYGIGAGVSIRYFQPLPGGGAGYPLIVNNKIVDNFIYEFAGDGGGIGIVGSSPEIRNNVIARNQANQNGGGICMWEDSAPVIANNFIIANVSNILDGGSDMNYGGGGIFASSFYQNGTPCDECISAPKIFNNVIAANGALKGGGLAITDSAIIPSKYGVALITNNTIAANSGAGIHWATAAPLIRNNLVVNNTWGLEQWNIGTNSPIIAYNNVFGNTLQGVSTNYEGISDATGTSGNISADPKLANSRIGDYHIQPNSPCVNAGSSTAANVDWNDIDGQPRIAGAAVDIGADESDGTVWNVATPVIRVKTDGDDANDGSNWANAKRTLAAGIQAAAANGGEVWVKAGTYLERITAPAFVHLYGGFAGTETQRSGRSIYANPTIIDGNNVPPVVSFEKAGYLISTLDGFFVQHGGTYVGPPPSLPIVTGRYGGRGGGLFIRTSGPTVENNTIRWNSIGSPYTTLQPFPEGAGIGCFIAHPVITANSILENENIALQSNGGGIYCKDSRPWIKQNLIQNNRAVNGAAAYCTASEPVFHANYFNGNTMYYYSGLIAGATKGAITLYLCRNFVVDGNHISGNIAATGAGICLPTCFNGKILNNVFSANRAEQEELATGQGAGIYCIVSQTPSGDHLDDVLIVNNTFVGNIAKDFLFNQGGWGGAMAFDILEERLVVANNIIAFNSSGIWKQQPQVNPNVPDLIRNDVFDNPEGAGTDYNYVNLAAGATDISVNPLFANKTGGDYHLQPSSPCIDNGDATIAGLPTTDIDGNTRPKDGDYNGIAKIDIGAYEFSQCTGDLQGQDGDVDGMDLVQWRLTPGAITLQAFASCFGRDDCQ
jgi:parallel beta-helix repeat protein